MDEFLGVYIPFGLVLCGECTPNNWEDEDNDYKELCDEHRGMRCNSCGKEIK